MFLEPSEVFRRTEFFLLPPNGEKRVSFCTGAECADLSTSLFLTEWLLSPVGLWPTLSELFLRIYFSEFSPERETEVAHKSEYQ